jgi:hypothetical protein
VPEKYANHLRYTVLAVVLLFASLASDCRWHLRINNPVDGRSTLVITTVTTGASLDRDGYEVAVRQGGEQAVVPRRLQSNDSQSMLLDAEGTYVVTLAGLAENCAVVGANPRDIQVEREATVETKFQVACLRSGH